jgi:hypothetical protein
VSIIDAPGDPQDSVVRLEHQMQVLETILPGYMTDAVLMDPCGGGAVDRRIEQAIADCAALGIVDEQPEDMLAEVEEGRRTIYYDSVAGCFRYPLLPNPLD